MRSFWRLGLGVALTMLVPLAFGFWLDHQYASAPLFVLVGALFGIVVSTVGTIRFMTHTIETLANTPETTSDDVGTTR